MSEAALNPGAAIPPPPAGSDVVGTVTKPAAGSTFRGTVPEGSMQPGILVSMENVESDNKFRPGERRNQCLWLFAIEGREAEGTLGFYTSYSLHEKSSLPALLAALGKGTPAPGEPLKKSVFLGARVNLLIETPPSKPYQRITRVLRRS